MTRRGNERDWDFDDWTVEQDAKRSSQASAGKAPGEEREEAPLVVEDWLAGEPASEPSSRPSSLDKAGLAVAALLLLLFGGLAVAGVFTSAHHRRPPPPVTSRSPSPTTTAPSAVVRLTANGVVAVPTSTLKPGDTGSQVADLQQTLAALGYATGTPDGNYGPATQSAVARFQRASGLTADGVFGSQTLSALTRSAG